MYCVKCGTKCPDESKFCPCCGAEIKCAKSRAEGVDSVFENNNQSSACGRGQIASVMNAERNNWGSGVLKNLSSSPLALVCIISGFLFLLITFFFAVRRYAYTGFGDDISSVVSCIFPGSYYNALSIFWGYGSLIPSFFSIICFLVFGSSTVLISVGLLLNYINGKSQRQPFNTVGLTLIKVGSIIDFVFLCFWSLIYFVAFFICMVEYHSVSYVIGLVVVIPAFLTLGIIYYIKLFKTIGTVNHIARFGFSSKSISKFIAYLSIFYAALQLYVIVSLYVNYGHLADGLVLVQYAARIAFLVCSGILIINSQKLLSAYCGGTYSSSSVCDDVQNLS